MSIFSLVVLGVLGNYFAFSLFFGVELVFGSIFTLIAIVWFGSRWGVLVGTVAASYTFFLWGHPYSGIVLVGEALFVALFWRRLKSNLVLTTLIYWLFFGVTQVILYYHYFIGMDVLSSWLAGVKQASNGVFNAILANLIVTYFPLRKWSRVQAINSSSVFHTTFTWLSTVAIVPVLIFMIIYSKKMVEQVEKDVEARLDSIGSGITIALERWQSHHVEVMKLLKTITSKTLKANHKRLQVAVEEIREAFPYFFSVYVVSANDKPLAFDPLVADTGQQTMDLSIAERFYFLDLQNSREEFVLSPIYKGISFFKLIVVIGSAVREEGDFVAGVFASIDVAYFNDMLNTTLRKEPYNATLIDKEGVVIASNEMGVKSLDTFSSYPEQFSNGAYYYRWRDESQSLSMTKWKHAFLGKIVELKGIGEWKLFIELPLSKEQAFLFNQYRLLFTFLLALILGIVLISMWVASLVSKPLTALSNETTNVPLRLQTNEEIHLPKSSFFELNVLIENFNSMLSALKLKFNDLKTSNEALESVTELGLSFRGNLDIQKIAQKVIGSATKLSKANLGIYLFKIINEEGKVKNFYSLSGLTKDSFNETSLNTRVSLGEGIVRINDLDVDASGTVEKKLLNNILIEKSPIRSYLRVPVVSTSSGKVIGDLIFGHYEAGVFTERTEKLVAGIAAQAAVAMDNARLYEALKASEKMSKQLAKSQAYLAKAGKLLGETLELDSILKNLAMIIVPEVADTCVVNLVNNDKLFQNVVVVNKNKEKEKQIRELLDRAISTNEDYGILKVIKTGKTELYQNIPEDLKKQMAKNDENYKIVQEIGMNSYICVPLKVRDSVIGVLSLGLETETFSKTDLYFIEEIASRASMAIDNAKLYHDSLKINRIKDEFLATLSHELRTPLNVILGYAEILKEDYADALSDDIKNSLDVIVRNARAQNQIIADLLDVSAIIAGKISFAAVPISVNTVAQTASDNIQLVASNKNLKMSLALPAENLMVMGDSTRLLQVIWNLLSNAVKFTPSGGEVRLEIKCEHSKALIVVSDSGQGIDEDFIPFIFDRFSQEDNSITRRFGGLGLGLSIVKQLVEMHSGHISVSSAGKNLGSTFTVTLPIAGEEAGANEKLTYSKVRDTVSLKGFSILVVDDEKEARDVVKLVLERKGAKVIEASTAVEGIRKYEDFLPDIIVSDISMPEEDGFSFLQRLRRLETETDRFTPAIALTAYARDEDRKKSLAAGFQAHLVKPFLPQELLQVVNATLAKFNDD